MVITGTAGGNPNHFTEVDTDCWFSIKAAGGNLGESQTRGPGAGRNF